MHPLSVDDTGILWQFRYLEACRHLQLNSLPPDAIEEVYFEIYDLPAQIAEFRKDRPSPRLEQVEG